MELKKLLLVSDIAVAVAAVEEEDDVLWLKWADLLRTEGEPWFEKVKDELCEWLDEE